MAGFGLDCHLDYIYLGPGHDFVYAIGASGSVISASTRDYRFISLLNTRDLSRYLRSMKAMRPSALPGEITAVTKKTSLGLAVLCRRRCADIEDSALVMREGFTWMDRCLESSIFWVWLRA